MENCFEEIYRKAYDEEFEKIASGAQQAARQALRTEVLSPEQILRRREARGLGKDFAVAGKIVKRGLKRSLSIAGKAIR